jgi:hypothetical protein
MKAIVAILSAALVALGGGAIHLSRQLDASRHQVAALQAQVDTTAASVRQAATIAPSPSLPLAEPTAAAPAAAPAPDAVGKEMERIAAMIATRRSPESMARVKTSMIGMMSNDFPDVGKVLGLSRDEVDQLFDLLYEQAKRSSEMDPMSDAASVARMTQTAKDELVSLLGSKYAKWEEYRTELPTRRHVKDLTVALDAAGTPLSDEQSNFLIPTLVAEERRNSQFHEATHRQTSSDRPMPAQFNRFTPEANRNLLNAAAAYLTPQQMETYSQVLERASIQETTVRNGLNEAQKYAEAVRQGQR